MTSLDPQVQIKLIEVSKAWAEKASTNTTYDNMPTVYPKNFDIIYEQLVKTVSEK